MASRTPPPVGVADEYYAVHLKIERVMVGPRRAGTLSETRRTTELLTVTVRQGTVPDAVTKAMKILELAAEPEVVVLVRGDWKPEPTPPPAVPLDEEDEEDSDELEESDEEEDDRR